MSISKSTRHSKITGDFAEGLVLYWLSRDAFECARVDHTGIDLIARNPRSREVMGISVKSRSRYAGTEKDSVSLFTADFAKVKAACKAFGCVPYYSIVVDGGGWIRLFLTSMAHLKKVAKPGVGKVHWGMTDAHIARYRADPKIMSVELTVATWRWWEECLTGTKQISRRKAEFKEK
jgi:hypothetical protein